MDQFSQIVASGNFVILDTETTGLHNAERGDHLPIVALCGYVCPKRG